MHKYVIIAAGGSGTRMQRDLPKQFLLLNGQSLLVHSIQKFKAAYTDINIILAVPTDYKQYTIDLLQPYHLTNISVIDGGETRFHSVQNGVKTITEKDAIIFVHDAARCLVSVDLIQRCYNAALAKGNAIPAIPVTDSLRIVNDDENNSIDRSTLRAIQTPQTFVADSLQKAFTQLYDAKFTDEASVVEQLGIAIHLIDGEVTNIKITNPIDLQYAAVLLNEL